jgi:hypothetical protein
MRLLTLAEMREQVVTTVLPLLAGTPLDVLVVGALLVSVLVLSLVVIWQQRRRVAPVPALTPAPESGFMRWLTPLGMTSVAGTKTKAMTRSRRKTPQVATVRVITPVSKVHPRALRAPGATPLEIARRTGLARDAVSLMLAHASAGEAPRQRRALPATTGTAARSQRRLAAGAAPVDAPAAYAAAPSAGARPAREARTVGTRLDARIS